MLVYLARMNKHNLLVSSIPEIKLTLRIDFLYKDTPFKHRIPWLGPFGKHRNNVEVDAGPVHPTNMIPRPIAIENCMQ